MADFIAAGFNPVLKDIIVHQRWPTIVIGRRKIIASKMEDSWGCCLASGEAGQPEIGKVAVGSCSRQGSQDL